MWCRSLSCLILCFALLALFATHRAEANQCNLYGPQRFGEIREGCTITVFALPEVDPSLPNITRNGQAISPTIVQEQITLKVTFEHYPSPDSCDLIPSYENRTFDRYLMRWPDLRGGDEILIDDYPYPMTVPGPGDCGTVAPSFYCQDGVQFCDDTTPPDSDPDHRGGDVDVAGCSAGSGAPSWLAILGVLALVCYRRSRTV